MTYLIISYLLACFVLMLVFFPSLKDVLVYKSIGFWVISRRDAYIWWYKLTHRNRMQQGDDGAKASSFRAEAPSQEYMVLLLLALCLTALPPLLVWSVAEKNNILDGFDDSQMRESNDQIITLLSGEKLVPPPALPPEIFSTQDVLLVRPALVDASRDWILFDDSFSQHLLIVFKIMREQYGYEMALLEGYRSPERQNALANLGSSVTNAKAYQSYHQFGLAADCAFKRNGKLVVSEKDPWAMRGYQLYGEVAKSVGLTWGGDWTMMDFGHVELRKPSTVKHQFSKR
jgi:peptidoglycan L-alanyl-D-glutamate endopeptidase CwlK